jgi:hypothetical protein
VTLEENMKPFRMKIDDIEARTCDEHLSNFKDISTIEIVKWEANTCFTVACFNKDSDGFFLKFVGSRPFQLDSFTFFEIARNAQAFLDKSFQDEA